MELILHYPGILVVFAALIALEYFWRVHRRKIGYDVGSAAASIGVAVGQFLFKPLGAFVILLVLGALYDISPFAMPVDDWRVWVAGFFAVEFAYYWFHRTSHIVRWLWATHAVHHSPTELVLPSALRLGWTEFISGGWVFFAALALLGFPPVVIGSLLGFNLIYQFPLHTEAIRSLGPLEWVLNTPSHHRAHHSRDREWLDCNFGGVLIIFDRMFGTFRAEPAEGGLNYGLVGDEGSNNPFRIALREWGRIFKDIKQSRSLSDLVDATFGRPR